MNYRIKRKWSEIKRRIYFEIFLSPFISDPLLVLDVERNFDVLFNYSQDIPLREKFKRLMVFRPIFPFIFSFRTRYRPWLYKKVFGYQDFSSKIFGSTQIDGGLMCYHPYATVINAKSIGKNFTFRNGLTIGNKNDDNTLLPIIGDNVEVGANVVIIGKIQIGDNVTIGAGSVVVKDVPDNAIVAGNPARVIRIKKPFSNT